VLTSASNAVITVALFSVVLMAFLALTGRAPSATAVGLYGLYMLQLFAIVSGFSLAASVLFMRYRDLNQVWEVITQAGFFIAPIVYPIGILPERLHVYLYAWPPTPIILFARSVLLEGRVPSALAHGLLLVETCLILGAGMLVYTLRAPRVAEEL
jgi:homopolymeric O-antigen transport system permease protein